MDLRATKASATCKVEYYDPQPSSPNGYGLCDMAGNVTEWVNDGYSSSCYQYCVDQGIVNDPPGPVSGTYGVLRGCSWSCPPAYLRVAARISGCYPDVETHDVGFRCARGGLVNRVADAPARKYPDLDGVMKLDAVRSHSACIYFGFRFRSHPAIQAIFSRPQPWFD